MERFKFLTIFCLLIPVFPLSSVAAELPRVELQTSMGSMELELFEDKAPVTVENFLKYVKSGFYEGMIFHRVVNGWIIQGGGYDKDLVEYETLEPIKNEADNGLKNLRGTVAMARHWDPHSADSQFFINLMDNPSFDHKARTRRSYGYCVFARVVKGMDVADAIGEVETHEVPDFDINVPVTPVVIEKARILSPP